MNNGIRTHEIQLWRSHVAVASADKIHAAEAVAIDHIAMRNHTVSRCIAVHFKGIEIVVGDDIVQENISLGAPSRERVDSDAMLVVRNGGGTIRSNADGIVLNIIVV